MIENTGQCHGKIRYPSPNAAHATVRHIVGKPHRKPCKRGGRLMPYKCRICGAWHVGHNFNHEK